MSELFNIEKIMVGAEKLTARIAVNEGLPTMTSEDIEATARVYYLAPEIAHLLEHLSVEIMRETGLAGDISCGRTRRVSGEDRTFEVELSCPDDTLTIGALSSATFMMDWAFLHGNAPAPDFPGTVAALRNLVLTVRGEQPDASEAKDESEVPAVTDTEGVAPDASSAHGDAVFGGAAAEGPRTSHEDMDPTPLG